MNLYGDTTMIGNDEVSFTNKTDRPIIIHIPMKKVFKIKLPETPFSVFKGHKHNDFSWHEWFAWYPVSLMDGLIFLRTVERIRVRSARLNIAYWVYREVGERPDYKPACEDAGLKIVSRPASKEV